MAGKLCRMNKLCLVAGLMAAIVCVWGVMAWGVEMPKADAQGLWRHINQVDDFRKWGTWQEFDSLEKSYMPYGFFRRVYVNSVALKAKGNPLPPGSILVRVGYGMDDNTYAPTDQIVAYTVMYKVAGFNHNAGDWFWVHYSGTGQVLESGVVDKCIECHDTARDNDWVVDHKLEGQAPDPERSFQPPDIEKFSQPDPALRLPAPGANEVN